MKFELIANEQQRDGFKLKFDASTQEDVKVCKELTEKVIEKITKIEVKISNEEY